MQQLPDGHREPYHPICYASFFGFLSVVRAIRAIESGSINAFWAFGAASTYGPAEVAKTLLIAGADPNRDTYWSCDLSCQTPGDKHSPLTELCVNGQYEVAKVLVSFNASTALYGALHCPPWEKNGTLFGCF